MSLGLLWKILLGSWLTAAMLLLFRLCLGRWLDPRGRALRWLLLLLRLLPLQLLPIPIPPLHSPVSLMRYAPDLETAAGYLAPAPAGTGAEPSAAGEESRASGPEAHWPALRRVWLLGMGAVLSAYLLLYLLSLRKLRSLPPCGDLETKRAYLRLQQSCHPGFNPRLLRGSEGMLGGFLHPALVIPAERSGDGASPILLHELMHYRAGDVWLGLLYRLVCAGYWYDPAVWLCFWAFRRDAELACDRSVLDTGLIAPADYAAVLLEEMALRGSPDPMPLVRFRARGVRKRVRSILGYRKRGRGAALLPAILALAILALAALSPYAGRSYGFGNRDLMKLVGYADPETYIRDLQPGLGLFGLTYEQLADIGYLKPGEGEWTCREPDRQILTVQRGHDLAAYSLSFVFRPTLYTRASGTCVLTEIRFPDVPDDESHDSDAFLLDYCRVLNDHILTRRLMYGGRSVSLLARPYWADDWGLLDWTWEEGERQEYAALDRLGKYGCWYAVVCSPVTVWDCLEDGEREELAGLATEYGMAGDALEAETLLRNWYLMGMMRVTDKKDGTEYALRLVGMGIALYMTKPAD